MTVSGTDLAMTRGDSESITVSISGQSFTSGDTITFTVRPDVESEIVLQKTVTSFTDGKAVISILPADTASLTMDEDYIYDIQFVSSGGTVTTIVKPSKFTIEEEVTY